MARPSKIGQLPDEILEALNAELIKRGFNGYEDLSDWLKERGYNISKSAVHRHGSALEAEFEAAMADARRTRALARAARESGEENDDSLMAAASNIMQDNLLRVSLEVKHTEDDTATKAKTLSQIARAFSDVGRLDIARQKWQEELQAKAQAAADKVEKIAKKGGMSAQTVDEIRRSILGIAA